MKRINKCCASEETLEIHSHFPLFTPIHFLGEAPVQSINRLTLSRVAACTKRHKAVWNEGAHLCNPIIIQSTHIQQFTATEQSDMKETYSTCNTLPPTRTFLLQQCWREGAREDEGGWRDEWETDRKEEEHLGRIGRRRGRERESARALGVAPVSGVVVLLHLVVRVDHHSWYPEWVSNWIWFPCQINPSHWRI